MRSLDLPRTLAHVIAQEETLDWLLNLDPLQALLEPSPRMALYRQLAALSLRTGQTLQRAPHALAFLPTALPAPQHARLVSALTPLSLLP